MKYLVKEIPEDHGYLIPIGDIHFSDKHFNSDGIAKLKGYLEWVSERDNAWIFLMGDIFNVAGRCEKSSPFEQKEYMEDDINEYTKATDFFKPYAHKIIGAIDGNHEERMNDEYGISPLQMFCRELKIPYCKYSAIVRFKVGKRKDSKNRFRQNYFFYMHHTIGGGNTVGAKLNRVAKLRDIVEGVDVMCGGHNHQLAIAPQEVYYPSIQGGIMKRRIWFVDCGSFVDYQNSYAEMKQLSPTKLGSPRIRMSGNAEHDVHCSL